MGSIFIVGMPRSGTTLVSAILDAHHAVAITPESHFFRLFCRRPRMATAALSRDAAESLVTETLDASGFKDCGFSPEEKAEISKRALEQEPVTRATIFNLVLDFYRIKQKASVVGEKTPDHFSFIDSILRTDPSARLLFVFRDPRDVSLSLQATPFAQAGALFHAMKWQRCYDTYRDWQKKLGTQRILLLKYEDLLTSLDSQIERMCRFLGVDVDPQMKAWHEQPVKIFDRERETWKGNALGPLKARNFGKWKEIMSPEENYIFRVFAGRGMKDLSYELELPRDGAVRKSELVRLLGGNIAQILSRIPQSILKTVGLKQRGF